MQFGLNRTELHLSFRFVVCSPTAVCVLAAVVVAMVAQNLPLLLLAKKPVDQTVKSPWHRGYGTHTRVFIIASVSIGGNILVRRPS